jgi:hypothetical protein
MAAVSGYLIHTHRSLAGGIVTALAAADGPVPDILDMKPFGFLL